ncbi:methionine ABC transporter ATP-binding protein [Halonatronum saccharophilum]|uniref:methionine ABC transporter ATP-binding protein n=1 Tax=Halonatronum saccharophilum TaxID=150060 RepID=UPI000482799C|nr:methionine ABC transporter ATP-binding protein [Halonatronum saccharophilum]
MIEIINLKKVYSGSSGDILAFEDINLNIEKGQIFGIIGPSGAGKSSLIRCLNLLEDPTEGQVIVDGIDLTTLPVQKLREERKSMGMIFQRFNLLKSRTVASNVAFPMEIKAKKKSEIKERVKELLKLVGLEDKADNYPSQLSGGQQQRVGIARALANNPKVLLCDESTSALDPETTHSILDLLKKINEELGITILLITHEMEVIKEICTKVAVLDKGRIVEQGDVVQIFSNPQNPTTRKFIERVVNANIPDELLARGIDLDINDGSLVRVSFVGVAASKPIISSLIHQYSLDANILYGNIDKIQGISFGTLIIELTGDKEQVSKGIKYLSSKEGVRVEVLNDGRNN